MDEGCVSVLGVLLSEASMVMMALEMIKKHVPIWMCVIAKFASTTDHVLCFISVVHSNYSKDILYKRREIREIHNDGMKST